jgi:UDP:flavonoid glycosyltransferase YjiC (YdhE family)
MARIGIVVPGVPGHINPVSCVGRELQARGHRVVAIEPLDSEDLVRNAGLDYEPIGRDIFPPGALRAHYARLGEAQGLAAMRFLLAHYPIKARMIFGEGPDLVRRLGLDILLVDQVEVAWACVADHLRLPFITVSNALLLDHEPAVPPFFTGWPYRDTALAGIRNRLGYALQRRLMKSWSDLLQAQRIQWNLPLYSRPEDSTSPWAHVSQQPAVFDFPRKGLPPQFHYTGPWHDARARRPVPFPFGRLNGKPLIYASMGTLQNRVDHAFREIARACDGLDAQLVLTLGGGKSPEEIGPLPGDPIVVPYAPQLDLLARAALTITHAGLNTALEALSVGCPMVAIPVGSDQPGVAARIRWLGAGEVLPVGRLSANRLRPLVSRVLAGDSCRAAAARLRDAIAKTDGIRRAADIVEQVLVSQKVG